MSQARQNANLHRFGVAGACPARGSGILVAVTNPGRAVHWWYSKADRARVERLSDQIDEAHRRAETACDQHSRERYLRCARSLERTQRIHRTYPLSIWLWGASIVVAILPWSILARAGHPGIGWAISAVVLVSLIYVRWRLRRRQKALPASPPSSGEESA
jgi:Flp pilus assembly protein TadB